MHSPQELVWVLTLNKNKYLEAELEKLNMNNESIWSSIITSGGSVTASRIFTRTCKKCF